MADPLVERLFETYDAFAHGRLERIPELFDPDGYYRTSGVFPGMRERYTGYEEIAEFWHQSTEPWEHLEIETGRTLTRDDRVAAEVWLVGRGLGSGVDVRIEAGHLVRFRELKIVEFHAFAEYAMALAELETG
jgi:ketosteroid isomerase-like protein